MSLKANYYKHTLKFKFKAGTSRGVLTQRDTFILKLSSATGTGYGEASPLKGLSPDFNLDLEKAFIAICKQINQGNWSLKQFYKDYSDYPSIIFALETAFLDVNHVEPRKIFSNDFYNKKSEIPINGLVWMGDKAFMQKQITKKLEDGFKVIKLKIGALDFSTELNLLKDIRKQFNASQIEIRVDANGAFTPEEALEKLKRLSDYQLHSIEQPIKAGQKEQMAALCKTSPLDIALDEELINCQQPKVLLETIKPPYIILKPTLLGGFKATKEWIDTANKQKIGWWVTSALESNIGLNAIAQFTAEYPENKLPHGLGTGQLYENNFSSPLEVKQGNISLNGTSDWDDFK